ncbi:DUF2141 domain-containing protein [Stakelama saccharophila]|uniref:DUF2141 domain-containing protein n=1 Tax=Stakelama saccharophila TaxID=3075605 RepID=A0ABZ0B9H1_9SPHN|nr:DUF2141 domain-containing protein [Stakelama sp. W311]WNO54066.1 DUF2141 domain-containing protein [Stakelama sp. W311]
MRRSLHHALAAMLGLAFAGIPPANADAGCTGRSGGGAVKLNVVASGLRDAKGEVAFTIYPDDRSRFLASHGKLLRARVPARAPVTRACFWLKPGHYAAAIYHDANADHDFNRTLFSIKEGFGFSNDAPTTLGLPSFADARFPVAQNGGTITIRMRYSR